MFKRENMVTGMDEFEIQVTQTNSYDSDYPLDINEINPSLQMSSSGNVMLLTPSDIQDETLDVALVESKLEFKPIVHRGPPERQNVTGPYNFQLEINGNDTHQKKFLYSTSLNRIYVDMKCNFSIRFKFDESQVIRPMYVRATTVFSDETEAQKRVERCLQHAMEGSNANKNYLVANNVLHSASEIGTQGEYYCGDQNSPDIWYSVLIHFATSRPHAFRFVCKNSCPGGINRRAIDIIFTLEDDRGIVYGRHTVGARVCACPKRDINRDEDVSKGSGKKRAVNKTDGQNKRIKLETAPIDDESLRLPPTKIVNKEIMLLGLETMLRVTQMMADSIKNDPQSLEEHNRSIENLQNDINEIKNVGNQ